LRRAIIGRLQVGAYCCADPRGEEPQLLRKFFEERAELPPWNFSCPGGIR